MILLLANSATVFSADLFVNEYCLFICCGGFNPFSGENQIYSLIWCVFSVDVFVVAKSGHLNNN